MAHRDELFEHLELALARDRIEVRRHEDTLNVSHGKGFFSHQANIDPNVLFERLKTVPDEQYSRLIAGFVRGVKHVLLEPSRSKAKDWSFVESAGGLVPTIEVDTFILGASAAAGQAPWVKPFAEDLVVAYLIELERGIRVLTEAQVARWKVSDDRITSGARSMLFHKTREARPTPYESFPHVLKLSVGDDYDAARCLVLADAFYSEINTGCRLSLPSPDLLLFVYNDTVENVEALQAATEHALAQTPYPLTSKLFGFDSFGKLIVSQENS